MDSYTNALDLYSDPLQMLTEGLMTKEEARAKISSMRVEEFNEGIKTAIAVLEEHSTEDVNSLKLRLERLVRVI